MRKLFSVLCIIMMLWFILPCFTGQIFNVGTITGFLLFLFLYLIFACPQLFQSFPFFLKALGIGVLLVFLCLNTVIAIQMIQASHILPKEKDTMIILGGGLNGDQPSRMLTKRLETAVEYLHSHPDINVIVSGGKGRDEDISEAEAMRTWLMHHHVSNPIYMENASTNTDENIHYSFEQIKQNNLSFSVTIVTDGFHEYRARVLCQKYGLTFHALPVKTQWWLFPTFYMREIFAILKTWIIR